MIHPLTELDLNLVVKALVAGLCLACVPAAAQDKPLETIPVDAEAAPSVRRDEGVPYTYVGLGYFKTDYERTDLGQDGFALEASYMFVPNVFMTGSYYAGETDETPDFGAIEVTRINLGGGYRHRLSMTVSAFATIELVEAELEAAGESESDSGYEIDLGLRGLLADRIEAKGEIQYLDVGEEGETYIDLQAFYAVLPRFQVGLELLDGDNQTSYGVLGRYSF